MALAALSLACRSEPRPLRIGVNPWPSHEMLFLAEQCGLFKAQGVNVQLVEFASLSDARAAAEMGQIDGLGATLFEVLFAAPQEEHHGLVIGAVVDASNGADVIVAPSSLGSIRELEGKRVGVELGSLGVYVLARALEREGLPLSAVQMLSADQATMRHRLEAKELDAVVTYPPVSVELLKSPSNHSLFSSAEIPSEVLDVFAFRREVWRNRSEEIARLLASFHEATTRYERDPEALAALAGRHHLTARDYQAALHEGMRLYGPDAQGQFFGPQGRLGAVLARSCQTLVAAGQLGPQTECAEESRRALEAAP